MKSMSAPAAHGSDGARRDSPVRGLLRLQLWERSHGESEAHVFDGPRGGNTLTSVGSPFADSPLLRERSHDRRLQCADWAHARGSALMTSVDSHQCALVSLKIRRNMRAMMR